MTCRCGRDENRLHCPFCGNATVTALVSLTRVEDEIEIRTYRCRKCGRKFDDNMRPLCNAPPSGRIRRVEAKAIDSVNSLTKEQRINLAHNLLKKFQGKDEREQEFKTVQNENRKENEPLSSSDLLSFPSGIDGGPDGEFKKDSKNRKPENEGEKT